MKINYYLDIETVANEKAQDFYEKTAVYSAPANWKDPAKIEARIAEQRQKDLDKAALNWWTGKIVCIGIIGDTELSFKGADEKKILNNFFSWCETERKRHGEIDFIGKNYVNFDKPYIVGRAIANDTGLVYPFRISNSVNDIDHIFSRSARCNQVTSLKNYAFGMGVDGKFGSGGDVANWFVNNDLNQIEQYCLQDIRITKEFHERSTRKWFAPID